MEILGSAILLIGSPIAIVSGLIALVALYLKFTDEPRPGWFFLVDNGRHEVINGKRTATVGMRIIGGATVYEPKVRVWGPAAVTFETEHTAPKLTCESDPMEVTVKYLSGEVPWVGITWDRPLRGGGRIQRATRVQVETHEYQRWEWHRVRNWFRIGAPSGSWKSLPVNSKRGSFLVEQSSRDRQTIDGNSVEPLSIWGSTGI
ncbi:hypothetical protein ACFWU5_16670 [Nocardia sp. NPDC058640]|uniref:hypothetical protein n=1 Tax=Nocardia sp. NPDC058640 TaxID=3346571 RepID=UPI00365529CA